MSAAMDFPVFLTIIQIRPCQQYGYSMFLFFGGHWGAVQSTSQNVEDELKSCALFDFLINARLECNGCARVFCRNI